MKKILLTISLLLIAFLIVPTVVGAHSGDAKDSNTGFGMMRMIEDQALGDELHEEMEELMIKMMAGDLTEVEAGRIIEFMDQHPGPGSMMMGRMTGIGTFGSGFSNFNKNSMMGLYGVGGLGGGILMIFLWILIIVGIVALVKYTMGDRRSGSSKSAMDILKERYAKGEIDKNEFDAKKKDMQ